MSKSALFILGMIILIFPLSTFAQADKHIASIRHVHIFSSSNLMGYLEPCG